MVGVQFTLSLSNGFFQRIFFQLLDGENLQRTFFGKAAFSATEEPFSDLMDERAIGTMVDDMSG